MERRDGGVKLAEGLDNLWLNEEKKCSLFLLTNSQ